MKQGIEILRKRMEISKDESKQKLLKDKYRDMVNLNTEKRNNCKIKIK